MFCKCPKLAEERYHGLVAQLGPIDIKTLLTKHADPASKWAIQNFGITSFSYASRYMLRPEGEAAQPKKRNKKAGKVRRSRKTRTRQYQAKLAKTACINQEQYSAIHED